MEFHEVLRIRIVHRPGMLAKVCAAVGSAKALVGDIETVSTGGDHSIREITVEAKDEAQVESVIKAIGDVQGVKVLSRVDRVFEKHRGGKIHCGSRVRVEKVSDLRQIYTPGVARVCRAIQEKPERARELTWTGNTVAICTNGTRVLGLGDIGVLASLPVMEGKAVLYDRCIGLSSFPLLVDTKDPREFVDTVCRVAKSFGGVHLEDISAPACFEIEAELDRRLDIPVMHDDRHGTAVAALVATRNACRYSGLDLRKLRVGMIGVGAAGRGISELFLELGVHEMIVTDRSAVATEALVKQGARATDLASLMKDADVVISATGVPGLVKTDMIRKGQVILALSNPNPEIDPDEALAAGASFAATGKSVNNLLGFPGLFRGAMDVLSDRINGAMKLAAVEAILPFTPEEALTPDGLDRKLHEAVAKAVAAAAVKSGCARRPEGPVSSESGRWRAVKG